MGNKLTAEQYISRLLFYTDTIGDDLCRYSVVKAVASILPANTENYTGMDYLTYLCRVMNDVNDSDSLWLRCLFLQECDFSKDVTVYVAKHSLVNTRTAVPIFTCGVLPVSQLGPHIIQDWLTQHYGSIKEASMHILKDVDAQKVLNMIPRAYVQSANSDVKNLITVYQHSFNTAEHRQTDKVPYEWVKKFKQTPTVYETEANIGRMFWRLCMANDIDTEYMESALVQLQPLKNKYLQRLLESLRVPSVESIIRSEMSESLLCGGMGKPTNSASDQPKNVMKAKSDLYRECMSILLPNYKRAIPEAEAMMKDTLKQVNTFSKDYDHEAIAQCQMSFGDLFPTEFFKVFAEQDFPIAQLAYACCVPVDNGSKNSLNMYLTSLKQAAESPNSDLLKVVTIKIAPRIRTSSGDSVNLLRNFTKDDITEALKGYNGFPINLGDVSRYIVCDNAEDTSAAFLWFNCESLSTYGEKHDKLPTYVLTGDVFELPVIVPTAAWYNAANSSTANIESHEEVVNPAIAALKMLVDNLPSELSKEDVLEHTDRLRDYDNIKHMEYTPEKLKNATAFANNKYNAPCDTILSLDYPVITKYQILTAWVVSQDKGSVYMPIYVQCFVDSVLQFPNGKLCYIHCQDREISEQSTTIYTLAVRRHLSDYPNVLGPLYCKDLQKNFEDIRKGTNAAFIFHNCIAIDDANASKGLMHVPVWLPS